jgi:hypothetical protein
MTRKPRKKGPTDKEAVYKDVNTTAKTCAECGRPLVRVAPYMKKLSEPFCVNPFCSKKENP